MTDCTTETEEMHDNPGASLRNVKNDCSKKVGKQDGMAREPPVDQCGTS